MTCSFEKYAETVWAALLFASNANNALLSSVCAVRVASLLAMLDHKSKDADSDLDPDQNWDPSERSLARRNTGAALFHLGLLLEAVNPVRRVW